MDCLTPPMFDVSNIDVWKIKMSMYLKTEVCMFSLQLPINPIFNSKHIKANAQALTALRSTLNKEYLSMVSHCDFAFAVWNTLTSSKLQPLSLIHI